jgi:hypothetical protein
MARVARPEGKPAYTVTLYRAGRRREDAVVLGFKFLDIFFILIY